MHDQTQAQMLEMSDCIVFGHTEKKDLRARLLFINNNLMLLF
jgi:hypothetical protein